MILVQELTALDSEISSLQALIEVKRQQQEVLTSAERLASEALARLTQALYKIEEVAPTAIASLKSAVLTLFADGDGDDGPNSPTDPDTDPTPPLEFEISAVDANGEEIEDGSKVQIINGGLNSGDIGTATVVGDNYLEIDVDQPSDPNQNTAGTTYKHSQDVVTVPTPRSPLPTPFFNPGSIIADANGSFGIVVGANNLGMRVDWLGLGEVPNPASGKGVGYDWKKDEQSLASLKPGSHDRIKLLTTEEFLQFQGWEEEQLDEHWDNEWFDVGVGEKCKWGGATINRWIVVLLQSEQWASPFASPLASLLWEDAPLLGQYCTITQSATEDNENNSTNGGEAMPYVELVKVCDHIAYQKKSATGEIVCTYFGFKTKAHAQSWLHFFEAVTYKVEMRQAKRLEDCKWEIKAKKLSMSQIERYARDCDFSKSYRSEVASSQPPSYLEPEHPQPVNLDEVETGDIVTSLLTPGDSYEVIQVMPDGTLNCKSLRTGVNMGMRSTAVTLVQKATPETKIDPATCILEQGDIVEVISHRHPAHHGLIGTVEAIANFSELQIQVKTPRGTKGYERGDLKFISKGKKPQPQANSSGQQLLGNRIVTTGNYTGLARRNAINNFRTGQADKLAAIELMKSGLSKEQALAAVTGTDPDDLEF